MDRSRRIAGLWLFGMTWFVALAIGDEHSPVAFERAGDQLKITLGGEPLATYVVRDETILRPYFKDLHAPGGIPVTRHFLPVEGTDPIDHATMHPGIWLAFGDINGVDFWRNKGRVEHEEFIGAPQGGAGRGHFTVRKGHVAAPGPARLCFEARRVKLLARASA